MRPPSRHRDPPLNTGLDLPEAEDDLPSLDEDSDSSDEFEIELARASKTRPHNRQNNSNSGQAVPFSNNNNAANIGNHT